MSESDSDQTLQRSIDIVYEVYQDFQEYIYKRFKWPTSVVIKDPNNSITRCFPHVRYRGFCEFCRELRDRSGVPDTQTVCIKESNGYVLDGIMAEESGQEWEWGWRQCHMGLLDFFIPIRTIEEIDPRRPTMAVLSVGQYRAPDHSAREYVHDRIKAITVGKEWTEYFPNTPRSRRREHAKRLEQLVRSVPIIDEDKKRDIHLQLAETIALMETIGSRVLQRGELLKAEDLVQSLGLEQVAIGISETDLWWQVGEFLDKIVSYLPISCAVVYASAHGDYTEMKLKSLAPSDTDVARLVGFESYDDCRWLAKQDGLKLPTEEKGFWWMCPQTYFGAQAALVYAMETETGDFVLMGFGHDPDTTLNDTHRVLLGQSVCARIFRFIQSALFGIELDFLMAETGHLMGRAYGKVAGGYDALNLLDLESVRPLGNAELIDQAVWAMEDGLTRLDLIRHNFYSFRGRRLNTIGARFLEDGDEGLRIEDLQETEINVVETLKSLQSFFERTCQNSDQRTVRFSFARAPAIVRGDENLLKLVFLNLFDNAIKFGYAGTYIEISVRVNKGQCIVGFSNLGIGVPADERERVFRRLTKARWKDPVRQIEGLGLGLFFCRQVIRHQFGGRISLSSREAAVPKRRFEGDNWITTVTIWLPLEVEE